MRSLRASMALGLICAVSTVASASTPIIYMNSNDFRGESEDTHYWEWVEVIDYTLPLETDLQWDSTFGWRYPPRQASLAPPALVVEKYADTSSTTLAEYLVDAIHISVLWLEVSRPAPAGGLLTFKRYAFGGVYVENIEWQPSPEGRVREVVTLRFNSYQMEYEEYSASGSSQSTSTTGWNWVVRSDTDLPPLHSGGGAGDIPIPSTISINGPSVGAQDAPASAVAREEEDEQELVSPTD